MTSEIEKNIEMIQENMYGYKVLDVCDVTIHDCCEQLYSMLDEVLESSDHIHTLNTNLLKQTLSTEEKKVVVKTKERAISISKLGILFDNTWIRYASKNGLIDKTLNLCDILEVISSGKIN